MLRNATWTLSNFCRGNPQPVLEQVKPTLPALQHLVHSNDEEVLIDACWALSYLSDGIIDKIQVVFDVGVCKHLVELLFHPSPSVLIPPLCTIGNIVTGDDLQTQSIISHGTSLIIELVDPPSQKEHQEENLLDHLEHHYWEQRSNTGHFDVRL
ncbi:hypothetical protein ACS0TY_019425 [Phlomoides rotata]